MPENWKRERILIWGKTRPELSQTYGELVCTGGLLESTKKLIRLYPIPLRYLDDERIFKKYQWIEASIAKTSRDTRPESYKINFNDIEIGELISIEHGSWDKRAEWILNPSNILASVEELQAHQKYNRKSLGIIKPKEVSEVKFEPVSFDEKNGWKKRYDAVLSQLDLPFVQEEKRDIQPIPPPDYRYKITFRCDDEECIKEHNFSVLDWEIDALYHNLRNRGDTPQLAATKVVEKLEQVCNPENDLHFFLGNISNHPQVFTIVGLWYPKKSKTIEQAMPLLAGM
ncbi:MAG: hypothetical protein H0W58_02100 [Acidobacteria bacterium]|jgi:hypothetical protein|nr:hypothetical protein [Acidobacteriota bacterium]